MNDLMQYLKAGIGICVGLYLCLGIIFVLSNGILGTHIVIKDLTDIFIVIFTKLTADHSINSIFNSERGSKP